MKKLFVFVVIIFVGFSCSVVKKDKDILGESGVSKSLAEYRAQVLKNISYTLHFDIPKEQDKLVTGKVLIHFDYYSQNKQDLLLDFKGERKNIQTVWVNGKQDTVSFINEHLILANQFLNNGSNYVEVRFESGNTALNRRADFMYTLFVPDRARTAFPCFDQPDLKAVFKLSLTLPSQWVAMANGQQIDSTISNNRKTYIFSQTKKLPTYLFSFVAGNFKVATEQWRGKNIQLFYRETDVDKIKYSLPEVFNQYKQYIQFYEDWTGIPYPFQQYGMVAIPSFQFGGMEHPGAVLLQSSTLFLPKEATTKQQDNRAQLLAHEVAHFWFGDLVTMKWFNDVWTKEVFANLMADKATAKSKNKESFDLKFLTSHYPSAFSVDRTLGANPIGQKLENLEDAGSLYGAIIYNKAPIMMRQLEMLMGREAFKNGIKIYLEKYAFSNATWNNLIDILDSLSSKNLKKWNQVWVNTAGRPIYTDSIRYKQNRIADFVISQKPEFGKAGIWQQKFDLCFYTNDSVAQYELYNDKSPQEIKEAKNKKRTDIIQYNALGQGYGVWPVSISIAQKLFTINNKVSRAAAYINLYENTLNGKYFSPKQLLDLFVSGLNKESEELNLQLLTKYIGRLYWVYIPRTETAKLAKALEDKVWQAMIAQNAANNKKILFQLYQNIFQSKVAENRLYTIWKRQEAPKGVALFEDDYTSIAFSLELRMHHPDLLKMQLSRIVNPDRKKRFEIIAPALSFDSTIRNSFFEKLKNKAGRQRESAILTALGYLHHPIRQPSAEKYLKPMLDLLPEVHKTNSIFFPERWLSCFNSYQSASAYKIVQDYLKSHPTLNPKLKEKILQAADPVRRSLDLN